MVRDTQAERVPSVSNESKPVSSSPRFTRHESTVEREPETFDDTRDIEVGEALSVLAASSPELLQRLRLNLFRGSFAENFEPIPSEFALLGITEHDAKMIGNHLKSIFNEVRSIEAETSIVIEGASNELSLHLPPFTEEKASYFNEQIESVFSDIIGPKSAKVLAQTYIQNSLGSTAAISGLDRVVTVEEAGEKFSLKTHVIHGSNDVSEIRGNPQSFSSHTIYDSFDDIPERWIHLLELETQTDKE